jgi:hypothetical protein
VVVYAKLVILNYFMDMKRSFVPHTWTLNSIPCLRNLSYDQHFASSEENKTTTKSIRYSLHHQTNKRLLKCPVIGRNGRLDRDTLSFDHHSSKHPYKSTHTRDLVEPSSL